MNHITSIENHELSSHINNLIDFIDGVNLLDYDNEVVENISRVKYILNLLSATISDTNASLILLKWLDETSTAINNLNNSMVNYINSKNIAHWNSCEVYIEIILQTISKLRALSIMKTRSNVKSMNELYNDYVKILEDKNEMLQKQIDLLLIDKEEYLANIKQTQDVIERYGNTFSSKIDSEQIKLDNLRSSYSSQMSSDKSSFDDLIIKIKEEFSGIKIDFENQSEKFNKKFNDLQIELEKDASEKLDKRDIECDNIILENKEKFEEYKKEVENIVGTVNTSMFSHKYKEVADKSQARAKNWHKLSVALMIAVSIFATIAFVFTTNIETTWVQLVSRIFATTTLATGAAYAARQASKQEKVERYARKIEMEFVSIEPFIESLDDERKSLIKEEIARKIFGNPNALEISEKSESYVPMDKLAELFKEFINSKNNKK